MELIAYPEMANVLDYFHRGSLTTILEAGEMAAISVMAAILSPIWNTPTGTPTSQYNLFVAGSGIGKERYTMGVRDLLLQICPQFIPTKKARSDVALLNQLRYSPARMFFFDEFGSWFKATLKSDSSYQKMLAGIFLEAYMGPRMIDGAENKLDKDCTDHVEYPIVNIIGGCTDDALESIMGIDSFRDDGLFGRFEVFMFRGEQAPKHPTMFDKSPPKYEEIGVLYEAAKPVIEAYRKAKSESTDEKTMVIRYPERQRFEWTHEAMEAWDVINRIYMVMGQRNRGLLGSIYARLPQRILRTACVLAAYAGRRTVFDYDIESAKEYHLRNLGSIEPLVRESLEETKIGRLAEIIRDALEFKGSMTRTEIRNKNARTKSATSKEIDEAIDILGDRGLVKMETIKTAGAPKTVYSYVKFSFETTKG